MRRWIAYTGVLTGTAVLYYALNEPLAGDPGRSLVFWIVGIYAATWVVATMAFMNFRFRAKAFTHYVRQGYNEPAAWEEADKILAIWHLATPTQPARDKERKLYEDLKKKYEREDAS